MGKLCVGLLFSQTFPKLTGHSWSVEGGRGGPGDGHVPPVAPEDPAGVPEPRHRQGAGMCSRSRLPALTGASLCWGGLRKTWGHVHADEPQPPQNLQGVFRGILGSLHADRSPGLLRTHGEASGRCGPTSTLTGALGPLQDLRGGFRKLWARTHPDRSSWAASGPAGRLQ